MFIIEGSCDSDSCFEDPSWILQGFRVFLLLDAVVVAIDWFFLLEDRVVIRDIIVVKDRREDGMERKRNGRSATNQGDSRVRMFMTK